tara:strand:- start:6013 stop:6375 length:363 start_codon:yes stop_codon:yes gene_type:complete
MATTYEWNCETVDCFPTDGEYTDVVYNVHWKVTAISDTPDPVGPSEFYQATSIGTQSIETSDLSGFTPFEDLTNADSVAWTKSAMGAENVTLLETGLDNQIAAEITPTTVTLIIGQPIPE